VAKIIIGIHGLSNKPKKELLEKWWKKSIEEGLDNLYKADAPDFNFKLVYWSDILHDKPLDENITDKKDPLFIHEPYKKGFNRIRHVTTETRKKVITFIGEQLDKFLLNKDLSINYEYITDAILKRYFADLESYYNKYKKNETGEEVLYKNIIRERLVNILRVHKKDKILLLAHSMGSIVAFDVLKYYKDEFKIDTFVTFGSPLGFPVVKGKIAAEFKNNQPDFSSLSTPKAVKKDWFNFSDIEDKVAINYSLTDDFKENKHNVRVIDYEVFNDYQIDNNKNPHKSYGYLRTEEFSKVIYEFLNEGKYSLLKRFKLRFFKFLIDIKIKIRI